MVVTWVSVVNLTLAIIDTTLAVNVTLSLSSQTWHKSHSLCELIRSSSIFSDEPFHWIPRKPTSSLHVWIGEESQQPHSLAWIHFVGCFHGNLTLSEATILPMDGDTILECSRICSNKQLHVFYVTRQHCICEMRNTTNVISLSSRKCNGSSCPGTKGGFCGNSKQLPRVCLCKYENVSVHVPPTARSPVSQTCDNTVDLDCEKCVNDGRLICVPGQTPKFRTDKQPLGFNCNGRSLSLHAEIPLRDLKGQRVDYLYGFQSDNTHSGTKLCLAWNTNTDIRISKPCDCSLKALCMYNGSLIGRAGQITGDGLTLVVAVTVGSVIVIVIFVCVGVWKFRGNEIRMKISNCMNTAGVYLGSCRSSDPESTSHTDNPMYSEATLQPRHSESNMGMYDNRDWGTMSRDHHGRSSDDQEGHYDSTRGGENGDAYDYLGQTDSQQRTKQRLANDYDTMAAVRAESGTEVTTT